MKCRDVMNVDPQWISSAASVLDAARVMRDRSVNYLLVFDSAPGPLRGIVTERDLVVRVCAENKLAEATPVVEVATAQVVTCGAEEDLRSAEKTMQDLKMSRLVVVEEGGEVVGVVALTDILRSVPRGRAAKTAKGVLASQAAEQQTPPDRIQLTPSTAADEEAVARQPTAMLGASRVTSMKVFPS